MEDRLKIVASAEIPPVAMEMFGAIGDVEVADISEGDSLTDADVLIVRSDRIDAALLDRAPRLRVIARTGVGLDKVDVEAATEHGIPVLYAPDAGTRPVAEGALALIFATVKRLGELQLLVSDGRWSERYGYEVRDLEGARLGIVGLGRIGSEVARLAAALGMEVIYHDPGAPPPGAIPAESRSVTLQQLFAEADVISLHCNLSESTRGMVDRELLSRVKPGSILVNASRGALIADDTVLVEALDRGWLAGVGLDVFAQEPPAVGGPILDDPRVVCTPHSIGLTRSWNERTFGSLAADLGTLLGSGSAMNVANPEVLEAWS